MNAKFWNDKYIHQQTGWDLQSVSPPIENYFKENNIAKSASILIPGCGNAYEAEFLLSQGFTNITLIDIAETLTAILKEKFKKNPEITIITEDFFQHTATYDYIIEQTFFCAINPIMRQNYVTKMHELLKPSGKLLGLLFASEFEKEGPPFGGNITEYKILFQDKFHIKTMEVCYNSVNPRQNNELFFVMKAKK